MSYTSDPDTFPAPVDLSHHLSRSTRAREASRIKRFYKYFGIPGISQLAGGEHNFSNGARSGIANDLKLTILGLPNDKYFPYDTLEAKVCSIMRVLENLLIKYTGCAP